MEDLLSPVDRLVCIYDLANDAIDAMAREIGVDPKALRAAIQVDPPTQEAQHMADRKLFDICNRYDLASWNAVHTRDVSIAECATIAKLVALFEDCDLSRLGKVCAYAVYVVGQGYRECMDDDGSRIPCLSGDVGTTQALALFDAVASATKVDKPGRDLTALPDLVAAVGRLAHANATALAGLIPITHGSRFASTVAAAEAAETVRSLLAGAPPEVRVFVDVLAGNNLDLSQKIANDLWTPRVDVPMLRDMYRLREICDAIGSCIDCPGSTAWKEESLRLGSVLHTIETACSRVRRHTEASHAWLDDEDGMYGAWFAVAGHDLFSFIEAASDDVGSQIAQIDVGDLTPQEIVDKLRAAFEQPWRDEPEA
jgi:hypothetical protein